MTDSGNSALLSDPALRAALMRVVRAKVPGSDAEDVVQATLTEALAAKHPPSDHEEWRRWLYGIARHKIADHFRAAARERPSESAMNGEVQAETVPHDARDLLQWAERELPAGDQTEDTLKWMLREGDGEKLEHIASEGNLDAANVRQRVSRLRRYFRERWAAQLAAVAAILLLVGAALWAWKHRVKHDDIVRLPPSAEPSPTERGRLVRRIALERCDARDWKPCLDGLDEAARLDPAGDLADDVRAARLAAKTPPAPSLTPPPPVLPTPSPSSSVPPRPKTPSMPTNTSELGPSKPPSPAPSHDSMTK